MVRFLDLKKQFLGIETEIRAAIDEVIDSCAFIGGKYANAFENDFSKFVGTEYCVGVGNGTDALEIAIEALGLPAGSEIIVPAFSFVASSEAVSRMGYKVVFCDIDPDNYTLCPELVKKAITANTSAIMAVHLYGHPCNMTALMDICQDHDLKLIEDCAQAHGAEFDGKMIGSIGDVSCFSFYPGKNLGAYGDAGAIVTDNEGVALQARKIANHGRIGKYDHEFEGRNSRLDGIQAAVLSVKLKYLNSWIDRRISIAEIYLSELQGIASLILPKREAWAKQAYHLFVVRTERRDELAAFLRENDIQCGIHYPSSLPQLSAYDHLNLADMPWLSNQMGAEVLSIPIGDHMSDEDAYQVCEIIKYFFKK